MNKVGSEKIVDIRAYRKRMKLDQFSFHHVLAETDGVAIVIFSKHGCNSCRAWKLLLEEYQRAHPDVAIYEVDTEKEMAIANEFGVMHLPALFLYYKGQYHHEIQCEASINVLNSTIQTLLAAPPQDQP